MNKRALAAALILSAALLTSCRRAETPSSSSPPEDPPQIQTLSIELPRELDSSAGESAMERLPELLTRAGAETEEVCVTFGTSHGATAQALEDGGVDLAFLPAGEFLQLCETAVPILGAAAQAELCAGPSGYGAALAELAQRRELTWAELDHARWGLLPEDSDAGYRCVELWLEDHWEGNGVSDLTNVTVYDSWTELLRAAAAEEIDLFPLSDEARQEAQDLWNLPADSRNADGITGFGRTASLSEEAAPIAETDRLFSWVAAVTPKNEAVNRESFQTALASALPKAFSSPEEERSAIGSAAYAAIRPEDLNGLRRLEFGT